MFESDEITKLIIDKDLNCFDDVENCDLTIKLSNSVISDIKVLANIHVHKLVIDAPNAVLEVAQGKNISVSGGSFSIRGTDKADTVKRGAQFIG